MTLSPNLFQKFADAFPTQKVGENAWGAAWRIAFYASRPQNPFIMRTAHYKLWASPKPGPLSHAVVRRGYWEATLTHASLPYLKPGGCMVDIGANFGHFGLVAAKKVGPAGRVFSFEPDNKTFELLTENIKLNGFDWMTPVQAAVGAQDGTGVLIRDGINAGGHSLVESAVGQPAESVNVPVFALDSYLATYAADRTVDVIKVDVQEFEAEVISGANNTIRRSRPIVACELSRATPPESISAILDKFASENYKSTVIWDSERRTEAASFEQVAAYCLAAPSHIDVVFSPKS